MRNFWDDLKFKNPSRKAETIQELVGKLEFFLPDQDPASKIVVKNILSNSGKAVQSAALKAAGIEFSVLDKKAYDVHKKKEEEMKERLLDNAIKERSVRVQIEKARKAQENEQRIEEIDDHLEQAQEDQNGGR